MNGQMSKKNNLSGIYIGPHEIQIILKLKISFLTIHAFLDCNQSYMWHKPFLLLFVFPRMLKPAMILAAMIHIHILATQMIGLTGKKLIQILCLSGIFHPIQTSTHLED